MITYVYITYCHLLSTFILLFVMSFDFFLYLGGYRNNTAISQHPPGVISYPQVIHRVGRVIHRLSTGYPQGQSYPQADTSYPQGASVSVP